jgi:VIT1/CCC1 family predicted Fe2+/Mn2+ transporter
MMINELGLMRDEKKPLTSALTTLLSFVVAGALPLLVYLVGLFAPVAPATAFPVSLALSFVALFALGAAKVLVTGLNPIRSGFEMLVVGGLAAGVAYVIGALLKGIGG